MSCRLHEEGGHSAWSIVGGQARSVFYQVNDAEGRYAQLPAKVAERIAYAILEDLRARRRHAGPDGELGRDVSEDR